MEELLPSKDETGLLSRKGFVFKEDGLLWRGGFFMEFGSTVVYFKKRRCFEEKEFCRE